MKSAMTGTNMKMRLLMKKGEVVLSAARKQSTLSTELPTCEPVCCASSSRDTTLGHSKSKLAAMALNCRHESTIFMRMDCSPFGCVAERMVEYTSAASRNTMAIADMDRRVRLICGGDDARE
jgi:hypothetical protein